MSGLPFLSKIEKVVSQQLTQHVTASNLNEQYHSAYRRQHSTETALLKIINDLLMVADNQQLALMASFLDLSAAFDTVDHSMLLSKLQSIFGVSGDALSWFASYLTGRTQSVKMGSVISKERVLKCCVPQ